MIGVWILNILLGRDIVSLEAREHPRVAFETFAARPKPPAAPTEGQNPPMPYKGTATPAQTAGAAANR